MTARLVAIVAVAFAAGSLAAPAVTGLVASEGAPEMVSARGFELVDAAGRQRARFTIEENGEVVLRLTAQNGDIRVKLGAGNDGSGLLLLDGTTEPGFQALAKTDGSAVKIDGVAR